LPIKYRLIAKTILFLCGFKIDRQRFGDAGFWMITNKPLPKEIHDEDIVFENGTAETGQIKKAKLVCDGEEGRVKCRWIFEIQK
jgi:hypothetical protein